MNLFNVLKGVGGGIKKGIGQLGQTGGEEGAFPMLKRPELGPGGTGGFAGNEGLPKTGRPMGGDAGMVNRPQPIQSAMPMLKRPDAPEMPTTRDSVDIEAQLPAGQIGVTPQQTQTIASRPVPEVRPPDLLGRRGATLDDTPMNHERYGYQTEYMKDGHVPRRWQDIAANAVHGAAKGMEGGRGWEGALTGAGVGAAGSAIDPTRARNFRFDQEQKPRLEAHRADLERGQDRGFELQKRGADLQGTQARTAATIAGTKDAELVRRQMESTIKLNEARALAAATGKLQKSDIYDPETGEIRTVWVRPDGTEVEDAGGLSGGAQIKREGFQNQSKMNTDRIEGGMARTKQSGQDALQRTRIQQSGATGRTGMTQAGQNARQKERLGAQYGDTPAPIGSVPTDGGASGGSERRKAIIQRAIDSGYTKEQAAAEADKRGIK